MIQQVSVITMIDEQQTQDKIIDPMERHINLAEYTTQSLTCGI